MNQGGGALGPLSGGPFNTSIGGGAGGDDGLMSSLLGRPPAQTPSLSSFLEGPSNTAVPPMRNFQSSPNFSSVMGLLALKNVSY